MKLTKLKNYIGEKAYKLFCKNYNPKFNTNQDNLQEYFDSLERKNMEYKVIGKAFIWKRTDEGYKYWSKINRIMWRAIDLDRYCERLHEMLDVAKDKKENILKKQQNILKEHKEASKVYKNTDYAMKLIANQIKNVKRDLISLDKTIENHQKEIDKVNKERKDLTNGIISDTSSQEE